MSTSSCGREPETSAWFPAGLVLDLEALLGRKVDVLTEKALHWYIRDRILAEAVRPVKDERLYLVQMLERAERIFEYTENGRAEFLSDRKTQDAVLRSFEVMGEAAKRLPSAVRDQAPEIPWRR